VGVSCQAELYEVEATVGVGVGVEYEAPLALAAAVDDSQASRPLFGRLSSPFGP
jgi:hypothetical protein